MRDSQPRSKPYRLMLGAPSYAMRRVGQISRAKRHQSRQSALAVLLGILFALTLSACTVCTEQIVDETTSPDHIWTTRTTVRDCGHLSTPTTIVYVQRADSRVKLGEIAVLVRRIHTLQIAWEGDKQVQVYCEDCGNDVKIARPLVRGITITVAR